MRRRSDLSLLIAGAALASCSGEPRGVGAWAPLADGVEATAVRGADAADYADGRLFVWGARHSRGFLYTEASDSWRPASTVGQPPARAGASVVWANGRVLWWGTREGKVYDPTADAWTDITSAGAPSAREQHSAVWTGARMIVWGGQNDPDPRHGYADDGALYDPVQDTWTPMSRDGAPAGRIRHVTVWTGTKMIVWGGQNADGALGDGAAYDPEADRWTPIERAGAPSPRFLHAGAWTGRELFVWGGRGCSITPSDEAEEVEYSDIPSDTPGTCADGARYDPELERWLTISAKDAPEDRVGSVAVWSGREVLLWGGLPADTTGRRWEPVRDAWVRIASAAAPSGRGDAFAFWTGDRMLVLGGGDEPSTGAFYRP